jgi:DNA polymerase-3 subunit epsilon
VTEGLRQLEIVALDCQASGSTPAYGDLLELGWATCTGTGLTSPVRSRWIVPRTDRPIPWAVRELTGWTEACVAQAVEELQVWTELRADIGRARGLPSPSPAGAPAVIHFARFELAFLGDLSRRLDGSDLLPLDVVCLHAIAARLLPDLPRRNIRALAGYLGHSPEGARRTTGHVEATAFIWRALLPLLEEAGVLSWSRLKAWLDEPAPRARRARRIYPLAADRRAALPDRPGVYRFLRRNGDVLYVGKAASLRKRVASHFKGRGPVTERGLELLTQVHDVRATEAASPVEAALLESDEIKQLDPPYNVQLRSQGRRAWFASRDLGEAAPVPDDAHPIGPLPSERALTPLAALTALVEGAPAAPALRAAALAVPTAFLPEPALFDEGFRAFAADHLGGSESTAAARLARASRALWLVRGRAEPDTDGAEVADAGPTVWSLARVRRRLERSLVQTGLLVRRARFLCLLVDATVAFRERGAAAGRALLIHGGEIRERHDLEDPAAAALPCGPPPRAHRERQAAFDAVVYDRLRVLLTELQRVRAEEGTVALRVGGHIFAPDRAARLMLAI